MFDIFQDAKEYGSIFDVEQRDYDGFLKVWSLTAEQTLTDLRMIGWYMFVGEKIVSLANQAKTLSQRYHVVVTNPPYMGASNMNGTLARFVKKNFPDSKGDLFACFIERGNLMTEHNGYNCMVTMQS